MKTALDLQLNQPVTVSPLGEDEVSYYNTRIDDVLADSWVVALPTWRGVPVSIREGQELECTLVHAGNPHKAVVKVLERQVQPLAQLRLTYPDRWQRLQRRAFLRWPIRLPVAGTLVSEDPAEVQKPWTGQTADISGGGFGLITGQAFPIGTKLTFSLDLCLGESPLAGLAQVVRLIKQAPKGSDTLYWYGLHFQNLTERQQDQIIRYVFAREREARARGAK